MIASARLVNFKAFREETLSLAPLTLLAGLNATGKSTVIQALALLRQSEDTGMLRDEGWLLNGDLVELGTGEDVLHENHAEPVLTIALTDASGTQSWSVDYDKEADVLRHRAAPPTPSGALFGDGFQYMRADRMSPAVSYPKSYHSVSRRRFLGSRGEFAAHFLGHYRDTPVDPLRRHPRIETTHGLLAQVNAWLQEVSPSVSIDVHEIPKTDLVRLSFTFGGTAGIGSSNPYRSTNVGFGLTYVFPIIVACLSTPSDGLVLIENPEAHLHPQGQMIMGDLLARAAAAGTQLIIETHSDHILNGVRLAVKRGLLAPEQCQLHFFRRNPATGAAELESPRLRKGGRLSTWPVGFFDQWDRALDELLD